MLRTGNSEPVPNLNVQTISTVTFLFWEKTQDQAEPIWHPNAATYPPLIHA